MRDVVSSRCSCAFGRGLGSVSADGLPLKRVDVVGRAHGGVETPHVVEYEQHVNPATGEAFVRPGSNVRPATPEELRGLE
ncbi:MAG: hypothetical protein J7518_05890 [Nocardioidaceae bacterium]|nr:hypothetical protein [Nocardioidaceae bacterium]